MSTTVQKIVPATMMRLGSFSFSLDTAVYQNASRSSSYKWAEQSRVGKNPLLQFTGYGTDTLTLQGVIFPTYRGGLGQVEAMRQMAGKGTPLQLTDDLGHLHGRWCITSVKEKTSDFLAGGVPKKVEFTLELKFFGESLNRKKLGLGGR